MSDRRRRQARVKALHAEGRSISQIAAQLGIGRTTAHRDLHAATPDTTATAPPPPPENNTRAVTHGAYSESVVAPVRHKYMGHLSLEYPHVPEGSRVSQAQRLAQIEIGADWVDQHGLMRPDGTPFDIGDKLMRWGQASERWYEQAAKDAKPKHSPADLLARHLEGRVDAGGSEA